MGIKCFSKDCQLITTTSPNNRRGLRPRTKDIPSANRRYYDRTNYSGAAPLPSALPVPRFLLCPSASTKRQTLPSADSERKRSDPSTATPPRTKANMSLNLSSYQKHLFSVPQKSSPGSSDSTTVSVADSMPWISEAESSKNAHLQSGIQQSLTSASLTKPNLPSELLQPRPLEICEMRNPLEIESMQERTCSAAWEQTREAFVLWDRNQVLLQHLESKLEINLMKQQFIQREYILQWSQQRLREIQVQMDRRVVKLAENLMTQQFAQCRAVEEELHNTRGRGHEIVAGESSFSEDEEQHNDGGKVLQSSVFDTLGHKGEEAVRVLDEGYVSA